MADSAEQLLCLVREFVPEYEQRKFRVSVEGTKIMMVGAELVALQIEVENSFLVPRVTTVIRLNLFRFFDICVIFAT